MCSKRQNRQPVSTLRNLGPKSAMMLVEAGISTLDDLRELGAVKAYLRVKSLRPKSASRNLLWALAAGLEDRNWRELEVAEKESLLAEVRSLRR
jgi:DNA transformation protein and related proteins